MLRSAVLRSLDPIVPGVASVAGRVGLLRRHALLLSRFPPPSQWPSSFKVRAQRKTVLGEMGWGGWGGEYLSTTSPNRHPKTPNHPFTPFSPISPPIHPIQPHPNLQHPTSTPFTSVICYTFPSQDGERGGSEVERIFAAYSGKLSALEEEDGFGVAFGVGDTSHASLNGLLPQEAKEDFASHHSLAVFPECVALTGISAADITSIALALLSEVPLEASLEALAPSVSVSALPGTHVMVCVHGQKDEGCGRCGEGIVEALGVEAGGEEEVKRNKGVERGVGERLGGGVGWGDVIRSKDGEEGKNGGFGKGVGVWRVSCVGGCEDAGNVVVYPSGDWLGQQFHPSHASTILSTFHPTPPPLERVLETFPQTWKGRLGMTPEEQREAAKPFLQSIAKG